VLESPTGTLLEHVRKSVLDSFAKEDDLLFRMDSSMAAAPTDGDFALTANGYIVSLRWERVVEPADVETASGARRARTAGVEEAEPYAEPMLDERSIFSRVITSATSG
jgi:hypothetical protein